MTRYSKSDERKIIAIAYIISYVMSAFMATSSVLAMFMAILFGMNTRDGKINHLNLIMPILVSSIFGGISTLVGSTQQVFANGLIEELGYQFKVFDFLPTGLILGVIGFVYCTFIGYKRGKKIWGDREGTGELLHQVVDLALLSNGMLKGKALADFIARSEKLLDAKAE